MHGMKDVTVFHQQAVPIASGHLLAVCRREVEQSWYALGNYLCGGDGHLLQAGMVQQPCKVLRSHRHCTVPLAMDSPPSWKPIRPSPVCHQRDNLQLWRPQRM